MTSDAALVYAVSITPFRTKSEANRSQREHWATTHRRAQKQRSTVYLMLRHLLPPPPPLPLVVHVTRVAPRPLDPHENLPASMKHVVDGVSDYLAGAHGQGQDRQEGLVFNYAQRRGKPREYGVEIQLLPQEKTQ